MRLVIVAACFALLAVQAHAQGLSLTITDTTQTIVAAQKGKRITLRLRSGQEFTGTVRESSDRLVVLAEVSGREFFDAIIPIDAIEAVLIRTRQ